jgi:hypothetical protein
MAQKRGYGKEEIITVDGEEVKVHHTERYERITVRSSDQFVEGSLRTLDIGRPGYSKLIRGKLKSSGQWATATYLISHEVSEETKQKLRLAALKEIRKQRVAAIQ